MNKDHSINKGKRMPTASSQILKSVHHGPRVCPEYSKAHKKHIENCTKLDRLEETVKEITESLGSKYELMGSAISKNVADHRQGNLRSKRELKAPNRSNDRPEWFGEPF